MTASAYKTPLESRPGSAAAPWSIYDGQTSLYDTLHGTQQTLPGLSPLPRRSGAQAYEKMPAPSAAVSPGQLRFGPVQEELTRAAAPARQLALLPDPPPWETDPGPSPRMHPARRLERKRRRLGISAGQQTLF